MSAREVELSVHPDVLLDELALRRELARATHMRDAELGTVKIVRRAIDARRGKVRMHLKVALSAEPTRAERIVPVDLPHAHGEPEVAIVGAGPTGMFCAWALARLGIAVRVLERGKPVRGRRHDLARLTKHGVVDPDSNYCFGEGGAGTFSDGKLYTRADKRGSVRDVIELLALHGAPESILVDARPHIGSNRLPKVVTALREKLASVGVEFEFGARVVGLLRHAGRVSGVRLADGRELPAR
ncbi:MAG: FAD-dependent monooxygenase, partial [Deltaproteobacteria bacterium]|nr:FAD-dependent monooxygenase [Nannocystaceae bacterium]